MADTINCVQKLLNDPNFKALDGKSKAESAKIVCEQHSKMHNECALCDIEDPVLFKEALKDIMKEIRKEPKLSKNNVYQEFYLESVNLNLNDDITQEDLDKINQFTIKPVTKDEIRVYNALLIDDQVTRNSTHYPKEFQKTILSLPAGEGNFIGAPFLLGEGEDHQEVASAQIGRIFDAKQVVDKEGHYGVLGKIYMLKEGNEAIIKDIDSGIKKEISISTKVEMPICSICHQDIRTCDHKKGQEGCHVTMTGKGFAAEVSLVAVPGSDQAKILNSRDLDGFKVTETLHLNDEKECSDLFEEARKKGLTPLKSFVAGTLGTAAVAGAKAGGKILKAGIIKAYSTFKDIKNVTGKINQYTHPPLKIPIGVWAKAVGGTGSDVLKSTIAGGVRAGGTALAVGLGAALITKVYQSVDKMYQKAKARRHSESMDIEFNQEDMEILAAFDISTNLEEMTDDQVDQTIKLVESMMNELGIEYEPIESNTIQQEQFDMNKEELVGLIKETMASTLENIYAKNPQGVFNGGQQVAQIDRKSPEFQISSALKGIKAKINEADKYILRYASKFNVPITLLPQDPVYEIDAELEYGGDPQYLIADYMAKAAILDNNLRSIEAQVKVNVGEPMIVASDADMNTPQGKTSFIYRKIGDILRRLYQMQGKLELEEMNKFELIQESVRLGTLANAIKFDYKDDVKRLFGNMTKEQITRVLEGFKEDVNAMYPKLVKDVQDEPVAKASVAPATLSNFKK